jgi:hypothetical protein
MNPWGNGELISLVFGVIFVFVGMLLHRRELSRDKVFGLAANGLTMGPLLMIVLDPLNKYIGVVDMDLLQAAISEARLTLWWAALVAAVNMVLTLLPSTSPATPQP